MKKEIADRWVTALRSGEYKQIRGRLKKDNGYCCLGVLCEVVSKDLGIEFKKDSYNTINFDTETQFLPQKVIVHTGIKTRTALLIDPIGLSETEVLRNNDTELTVLNDHFLYSFNQIADVIEQNYEQL